MKLYNAFRELENITLISYKTMLEYYHPSKIVAELEYLMQNSTN